MGSVELLAEPPAWVNFNMTSEPVIVEIRKGLPLSAF